MSNHSRTNSRKNTPHVFQTIMPTFLLFEWIVKFHNYQHTKSYQPSPLTQIKKGIQISEFLQGIDHLVINRGISATLFACGRIFWACKGDDDRWGSSVKTSPPSIHKQQQQQSDDEDAIFKYIQHQLEVELGNVNSLNIVWHRGNLKTVHYHQWASSIQGNLKWIHLRS